MSGAARVLTVSGLRKKQTLYNYSHGCTLSLALLITIVSLTRVIPSRFPADDALRTNANSYTKGKPFHFANQRYVGDDSKMVDSSLLGRHQI